jgi:uncharacterized protein YqeY
MIADTITKKIGEAMKAKDEIRLSTLRMLSSALNYEKIAKQHDLDEEEELAVVRRELKKRKDAVEAYEKAGAKDRAEKEKKEGEILEVYLPAQMDDAELEKIVKETISEVGATSLGDMGKIMGGVMPKVAGKADGGRVSAIVKKLLN